jgi:5-methylcytosine-specific restriction endonuclease McrA
MPDLAPSCSRCKHRHLPSLPCWGGRMVAKLRALVFAEHGDRCWLCKAGGADTVDHVLSRAMGGTDSLSNLRPAHGFCNTGRGAGALSKPPGPATVERSDRW